MFVCQNLRDPDAIQGSCMRRGSKDVLERLKQLRVELGLKTQLRVMAARASDRVSQGSPCW